MTTLQEQRVFVADSFMDLILSNSNYFNTDKQLASTAVIQDYNGTFYKTEDGLEILKKRVLAYGHDKAHIYTDGNILIDIHIKTSHMNFPGRLIFTFVTGKTIIQGCRLSVLAI